MRYFTLLALLSLGAVDAAAQTGYEPGYEPGTVRCLLKIDEWGYGLQGTCAKETAAATPGSPRLRTERTHFWPPENVLTFMGTGPKSAPPWRGYFVHGSYNESFEIGRQRINADDVRLVILMVNNGWVVAQDWRETGRDTAELVFRLNYAPATADDVAILTTALSRLRSIGAWDREDDRNCGNDKPGHVSLFCLLSGIIEARMGRYHHSQPALDIVRSVINERWQERLHGHGLMDFNNHPATTLEDLHVVLELSLERAGAEAAATR